MRKLLLPLLSLAVVGCSQNPHVNVASSPAHSAANAQATSPAEPAPFVSPSASTSVDTDTSIDESDLVDSDGDGVPDIYDKCPNVPGPIFNDGCPLEAPAQPFPPPASSGCPYPGAPEEWERVVLEMKDSLKFDFDRAVIKPESYPAIHHLERFMKDYPLAIVYMVGHTDDVGSDAYNMALSSARVFAVKNFLVASGIRPERVLVDARGKRQPLVSVEGRFGADLDYARAMNRRVDLDVRYVEKVER